MDAAWEDRASDALNAALAGLQAGIFATLWMLAWMGVNAAWQRASFWTAENLLATTFYGGTAIRSGFTHMTISGLALYLMVYGALASLFAMVVRTRLPRLRLVLVSVAVAVGWYYLSFHVIWKAYSPLITLLHAEQPTLLGHILYGVLVARFPRYLPQLAPAVAVELPVAVPDADPAPVNHEDA